LRANNKPRNDNIKEAKISGVGVPLKERPMGIASITPSIVDSDPIIEAASPAICPIGCIANAFRFPIIDPIIKNALDCHMKYKRKEIDVKYEKIVKERENIIPIINPITINFRIPTLTTRREFAKLATPEIRAISANH